MTYTRILTVHFAALLLGVVGLDVVQAEEVICRYCDETALQWLDSASLGPYRYAPDRQVDVQHIKLDVTPDFQNRSVRGRASITARVLSTSVRVLRLDAVNLKVDDVSTDTGTLDDFHSTRTDLQIAFREPLPTGTVFTVDIDYSAEPVKGLYFRTPAMGYPESDTHIWTQGETHEARHWFPCFDYPNERSSTEIICHVPHDMIVLSNGQRMDEHVDDAGLKAVRWLQEKPHVNYLICLVAGHFSKLEKSHRDVPLGFYTQPTLSEYAENSFADTSEIMAYFEREIGMEFPWTKYDQVTIRDFTAGGMENTTLTTLTHRTLFSKDTENIRSTRRLDAHEMAHQWFGDYVTCKDWSHLWLNEGFATYYAHLYEGHKFGKDAMLYGLYRDAQRILSRSKDTRPIVYNAYDSPREQFDYRSYPKASWVLHMLRCQLGESLYRKCVTAYLERHALSSVVSDDFRQVIEQQSGRSMDRFFDQWLYHGRYPDLSVTYKWFADQRLAKVTVAQTHEVNDQVMLFEFPTKLRFFVDDQIIDRDITVRRPTEDFYVSLPKKPTSVRFDPEFTVLAKVTFDKSDDLLEAQIQNREDTIGRLLAAEALSQRRSKASRRLLDAALTKDEFFGVRIAAANSLAKHETDEAFAALEASWLQPDARVRSVVVQRLTGRFHEQTPGLISSILETERNPAIAATAIRALGRFHGEASRKQILRQLDSESFRNELAVAAIAAIGQQSEPSYRKPLMKVLKKRASDFSANDFGTGLTTLAHVCRTMKKKDGVRKFIASYANHPKTNIRVRAIRALGTLGDEKAIPIVESFRDAADDRVSGAAKSALTKLQESKPTSPRELVELRKQLAEMRKDQQELQDELQDIRKQLTAQQDEDPQQSD